MINVCLSICFWGFDMKKFLKSSIRAFWVPLQIIIISILLVFSLVSITELFNAIPFETVVVENLNLEEYNLDFLNN